MKLGFIKNKILMFSVVGVLAAGAAAASGVIVYKNLNKQEISTDGEGKKEKTKFKFLSISQEKLDDPDDVGVMIMDCDNEDYFMSLSNAKSVRREGRYMQGTGALSVGGFANHKNNGVSTGYFKPVDISDYEDGSIHFSFYVNDIDKLGSTDIQVELTSSGAADKEELCWYLPTSLLNDGWNDVYFSMKDARLTGEPNLEKINYYRMFTYGAEAGLEFIFDAVYATNTEGTPLEKNPAHIKRATTKPGYLMDCDSLRGVSSSVTLMLTTDKDEHKEGTGAIAVMNPTSSWLSANVQITDITPYETGYVSTWVYINDASYCQEGRVYLELTSSGTYDKNEICWIVDGKTLKTGWNEMIFKIAGALDSSKEKVDKTKINFLRMYGTNCDSRLAVLVDGFKLNRPDIVTPEDGMIFTCDTQDRMTITTDNTFSITNKSGEFKQGTGAFKAVGQGNVFWNITPRDSYNITKFAKGGLHMWLYVSNPANLGKVVSVEISSSGRYDLNEYQWQVLSESLDAGWNELYLNFADAIVTKGGPDMSNINFMRVFSTNLKGEVTMIMDDVRAVMPEVASSIPGVISNCDSQRILSLSYGKLTTEKGQYKEGTGAFINTTATQVRTQFKLNTPVDISAYEDGAVHFWFYIDKPEDIYRFMMFEVGNDGNNFYRWMLQSSDLEVGWNELTLVFEEADLKYHDPDLSNVSYVRVLQASNGTYKQMTTIVDDVRAIKLQKEQLPENAVGMIVKASEYKSGKPNETFNVTRDTIDGLYMPYITAKAWKRNDTQTLIYVDGNGLTGEDLSSYDLSKLSVEFWIKSTTDIDNKPLAFRMGNGKIGSTYSTPIFNFETGKLQLKAGEWTKVTLNLKDALNASYNGNKEINWMRLMIDGLTEDTTVYLTGMHIVGEKVAAEEPDTPGNPGNPENPDDTPQTPVKTDVILNCDATDNVTLTSDKDSTVSVTTAEGEFKEGTGAYKIVGKANMATVAILKQKVDISDYAAGGIHLWLYVSDLSKVSNDYVAVEVSSSDKNDVDEHQWNIAKTSLTNGWNELYLPFEKALVKNADFTKICRVRIFTTVTEETTFIVDDVKAVIPVVKNTNVLAEAKEYTFNGHFLDVQEAAIAGVTMQYKEETAYNENPRVDFNNRNLKALDLSSHESLGQWALSFWMRSDVDQKITLSGSNFLQLKTTDGKTWLLTSGSIDLKAGEWTKVTFNLGSVTSDVTTASTFKELRFLLQGLKKDSKIAVTDMKIVEDNVFAEAKAYTFNGHFLDVQEATIAGVTMQYKEETAYNENPRVDFNNRNLKALNLSSYGSLNQVAVSFWMRSDVDQKITLSGSNFLQLKTTDGKTWLLTSGSIDLKAGEWTKVTFNLGSVTSDVTTASTFKELRFLLQGLKKDSKIAVTDMKIVEDNVFAEAKEYTFNGHFLDVQEATIAGVTMQYKEETAYNENPRVDFNNRNLKALNLSSYGSLNQVAVRFWMRSDVDQKITLSSSNFLQLKTTDGKTWLLTSGSIDLKAGEWTKVTFNLGSVTSDVTTASTFKELRFLLQGLKKDSKIAVTDMKLVQQ